MSTHYNNVAQQVSGTPGTGTITLGSAVTGAQTLGAAAGGNATVDVFITDGSAWEVARNCSYTHSGTTLTRGTLEASSTGSVLSLTSAAIVRVAMPASTGTALDNLGGAWGVLDGENSITGTATAVIGRLNVCSGTTSDYTVTLPAVSGNAGRYIGFRMAPGLTRLVTIDGNGSETIDGALTRVMWAQETALLYCDGTTWTKMAGKMRPMMCSMSLSSGSSLSVGTWTHVNLNTSDLDNTGRMASTSNGRIVCVRDGTYVISGGAAFGGSADGSVTLPNAGVWALSGVDKNTTTPAAGRIVQASANAQAGGYASNNFSRPVELVANDYLRLIANFNGTGAFLVQGQFGCVMNVQELPSW